MTETMPLAELLATYKDGDEHGWQTEFQWLATHHGPQICALILDIEKNGIQTPVLLGNDGRVWDGHHRIYVAHLSGIQQIPVEHA